MNSWPNGERRALTPSQHNSWNARNYPGTRQLCVICDEPTGRCEEDGIWGEKQDGWICPECADKHYPTTGQYLNELQDILESIVANTSDSTMRLAESGLDIINLLKEES